MNRLRLLHNGDLREDSPAPSAHWMAYVSEDGSVVADVITKSRRSMWPPTFTASDPEALFDIPPEFGSRQLQTQPHHEEIIVSLVDISGRHLCSFTMAELPDDCRFRSALTEIVRRIENIAEPNDAPNDGPATSVKNSEGSGGGRHR